jgi:hypothetical protein
VLVAAMAAVVVGLIGRSDDSEAVDGEGTADGRGEPG